MNKIYRLIWSEVRSAWVAAPETTKGQRKGSGRTRLAVSVALALTTTPVLAEDVNWAVAYPSYTFPVLANYDILRETGFAFTIDGDTATANHYAAGTTLNILGAIPTLAAGSNGTFTTLLVRNGLTDSTGTGADPGRITLIEATDANNVVTPITSANIDNFTYSTNPAVPQQNQELNVVVPGLDGSYSVIKVYDSSTFSSSTDAKVGDLALNVYAPNSFHIYNNFGIASVSANGGTANINIGADTGGTTAISAAANTLNLLAKNSTLAKADGTDNAASQVNWLSDNYVHFSPAAVIDSDLQSETAVSSKYSDSITLPNYALVAGRVVQIGTREFDITSAADIATVNNFLLGTSRENSQVQLWLTGGVTLPPENGGAVIDSTVIAQNTYNAIIQSLLDNEQSNRVDLTYHVWQDSLSHTNNATLGTGDLNVIYATGALATGTVTSTGSLAVDGASTVMRADRGATITNNGNINIWRSDSASPAGVGMKATDATATNTGTLNAGLFLEKNGSNQNVSNQGSVAMQGLGASQLSNTGYINVALTDSTTANAVGMQAQGTTTATNSGTLALTGNSHNTNGRASGYAADISGAATFTNATGGNIYIGTTPVTASAAPSAISMVGGAVQSAAIRTSSTGNVTNNGTITLGTATRNAVGMLVNGGTGAVLNAGTINVLGGLGANGSAAPNYGLSVTNTTSVTNTGIIRVTGENNVAINLLASSAAAAVNSTNSGTLTVGAAGDNGGNDSNPYTYRNYAVYAEGLNGNQATATINSAINLLSAGAIGVHARGSATINVGANALLNFANNSQIGYYAYGEDAKINLGSAIINDNAQAKSVLFLIDHGAQFDGDSGGAGAYALTVSGTGSTGVFANGLDTGADGQPGGGDDALTTLDTGSATISVNGENAVGVKITGGATGTINNGGILLNHNNSTAVVVDGRSYAIDGTIGDSDDALETNVLSRVDIGTTASQSGIKGYDISHKGNVDIESDGTVLAGSNNIGIYLHDGGIATNNAPISVSGTNNIGVYIQDQGTLTNSRDITVSGVANSGNVGVKVQGAGAKVTQLGDVTATGGLAAVQLVGNGAALAISGSNNQITASGGADGILMDTGSSSLTASNTQIDISGTGAGINNKADTSNINLTDVVINAADGPAIRTAVTFNAEGTGNILNVSGSGSGFAFEQTDGSNTTGNLTIGTGYTIDVTGANGNGILAKTNGSVTSGANITMGATGGAAISAADASGVTNNGNIQTSSNTNTSVLATNAGAFTNNGTINATGALNPLALIRINGSAASRTILNNGTITDASQNSVVIDASGSAANTVTNQGTLSAASNTATALRTGSGSDNVTLSGTQATTGLINLGSGADTFTWNGGTLDGAVDFTGSDGNDRANIGDVDLSATRHILSNGGSGSTLTFTDTHAGSDPAQIGSLAADASPVTNIGTGWSTLAVTGSDADLRVVDNLQLSGMPQIRISDGATVRSGDNVTNSALASINNYNVSTDGADSLLIFDGLSAAQTYSGIISGTGGLERAGGGTTILTGENTYTGNTLIESGGTLQLGNGGAPGALSPLTNITDNGVLNINQSDTVNLGGVISGTGAFYQTGSGTTRLSGANTYQGVTQVNGGTLLVNGDQTAATGATTVASGTTLGGNGTIGGDVTFGANTTLSPGDGGAGTLNIKGNLNLSATTNSKFELGQLFAEGGALNDFVNVGKNITLDGQLNVTLSAGGIFVPGLYRLFSYAGDKADQVNNGLQIVSLPPGNTGVFNIQTSIDHQVNLVVGAPENDLTTLQYWDGDLLGGNHGNGTSGDGVVSGGTGVWQSRALGDTNNWTTDTGAGNEPWSQSSFAIFQGQSGTVTVSNAYDPVRISGMQFDSSGYVLDGDPLTITRTADLVPSVNYQAQGETVADAYFVVRVGAGADGANVTTTLNTDLTPEAGATDRLKLLKFDPGRLILTGNNSYTGGTEIYNGTLNVSADENLGVAGASVLINNNATLQIGADYTTDRPLFLSQTGGGQIDLFGHTFTPTGVIGGLGPLTVRDSTTAADSTLVLNRANSYQGVTTVTGNNGATVVAVDANTTGVFGKSDSTVTVNQQGTVNFNNSATAQSHAFTLDSGILTFNDSASAADSVTTATDGAVVRLSDNARGGNGRFTLASGTQMNLSGQADGGNAVMTSNGLVTFAGQATGAGATIANNAGGVVNIADSSGTAIGSLSGAGNVVLGAASLTEGALSRNDGISGVISGAGGSLSKTGNGTLTLTGDNTYTGATAVQQGVLLVNGNQQAATGAVSVASGATLGGNGTLGGTVTVADNAHLAAGADLNSVGMLTTGGLTLNQNAQIDFQFGRSYVAGGSLNDLINVNGDLNLNGKLNITQTPGGTFDVGIYRVLNYTGALTNNQLDIGTAPQAADDMYVQTSIAGQVNLVNRTGVILRFWDGADSANKNDSQIEGGNGVWQNSSGNDNWSTDVTTPDGRFNAPFSDNSFAIFGGTKGNVTVDNSLGAVNISGAQFATDGYVVTDGVITTTTADTQIRVGDGTAQGADYTATINSQIAGSGGINKTDAGTLILGGDNTYRGGTTISAGTLQVSADNNLGQSGSGLAFDGGTLRYGSAFNTGRAVSLQSGGGTVDTDGKNVALNGVISGNGALTKTGGGTLTLTQDNTYTGTTTLSEGTVQLGNGGEQGSIVGDIVNNAVLQINRANLLTLPGDISGTGQLWQQGTGTTVLSGRNTYSGLTRVQSGTLLASGANTLSSQSDHLVSAGALLDTGGTSQTLSSLVNQGTVNLRGGDVGSTLTVNGDYVGMNGVLKIAAQQHSPGVADRLVINGGSASGVTRLDIDVSQLGEETTGDGITVVEAVNGATTTAQTTKDAFTLGADHLDAGAFQYRLFAADAGGAGEDWFLRATYRPDVPAFNGLATTVRQADLAVLGTLHLRVGDEKPYDKTVPEDQEGRFWARYIAQSTHQSLNDATATQADSRMNGMQAGVDLYQNESWRAGIYTTVLDIDTSYQGQTSGGAGYTSDTAFYLGGYATWTGDDGLYVDNVLQYGRHSVDLKTGNSHDSLSPDGNTFVASVEVGKPWQLGDSNWALEPQAQLIWQHSDFDSVIMPGDAKTRADIEADDAVIGRLGVRLTSQYDTQQGSVKPYVRVNLWQELSDGSDSTTFTNTSNSAGKTTLTADQRYSSTEVALGATWAATSEVQAYTEVGKSYQNGGSKSQISNDLSGTVGIKIRF